MQQSKRIHNIGEGSCERIMKILFKIRTLIATMPLIFCIFYPCSDLSTSTVTLIAGTILFTAGLSMRIWAQQYLGYRIPKKYRKAQRKKVVTGGPYQACRNPVYVGNILIIASLPLFAGAFRIVPLCLVWSFLTYHIVVSRYEEPHLLQKYGASYASYLQSVPRWIPDPAGIKNAFKDSGPFSFYLALRFELYNIVWTFPFFLRRFIY